MYVDHHMFSLIRRDCIAVDWFMSTYAISCLRMQSCDLVVDYVCERSMCVNRVENRMFFENRYTK